MTLPRLELHALTRDRLDSPSSQLRFLELIESAAPRLLPERFGPYEPYRGRYREDGKEGALAAWRDDNFFWTAPGVTGGVWSQSARIDPLGQIDIRSTDAAEDEVEHWTALLRAIATEFAAEYALVHPVSTLDRIRGELGGWLHFESLTDEDSMFLSIVPIQLQRYVPDVFWCTVFGPAYVELFGGRERVAALDVHASEDLGNDTFLFQLDSSPRSVEDPDRFEAMREAAKAQLGPDAFFNLAAGRDGSYRVPAFLSDARARAETPPRSTLVLQAGQQLEIAGDRWDVTDAGENGGVLRRNSDGLEHFVSHDVIRRLDDNRAVTILADDQSERRRHAERRQRRRRGR
jgi:hypothetical protein